MSKFNSYYCTVWGRMIIRPYICEQKVNELIENKNKKGRVKEFTLSESVIESSYDAIITKNLDGVLTTWNKGSETIYGYREKEAVGKPISFLLPPGHRDEVPGILQAN